MSYYKIFSSALNHTFWGIFWSVFPKFALQKGQIFYLRVGFQISKWQQLYLLESGLDFMFQCSQYANCTFSPGGGSGQQVYFPSSKHCFNLLQFVMMMRTWFHVQIHILDNKALQKERRQSTIKPPSSSRKTMRRSNSLPVTMITRQDSLTKPVVHTASDSKTPHWKQRGSITVMRSDKGSLASLVQEARHRRSGVQAVGSGRSPLMRRDSLRKLDVSALQHLQPKNN